MDYSISLTGNSIVDEISRLHLLTIPQAWYKTIRQKNAPHALAILILQDLIYWYTWTEVRSEETGAVIAYKKKFKADLLQRSYEQLAERFGITKRQAYDVIFFLQQLGVLTRVFRTVNIGGIKCNNVLFIQLHPDKIREISDERNNIESNENANSIEDPRKSTTASHENLQQPLPKSCNTNTNTTTNITTNISLSSACVCEIAPIDTTELKGIGQKQFEVHSMLMTYNKSAKQGRKIPVSTQLLTFVQKELRDFFAENKTTGYDELITALKNYLSVASSDSWKSYFTWRDFTKNYVAYTPEYFDEASFKPKQTVTTSVQPKAPSADFSKSIADEKAKVAEKERVEALRAKYDDFTSVRQQTAEKIWKMYTEFPFYTELDFKQFRLDFAEVSDYIEDMSSLILYKRIFAYLNNCSEHVQVPEDYKTVITNGLIDLTGEEE